jgi:phosphoserine phosphatase RsbU/P
MGQLRNFETAVFRRLRREPPQGKIHRLTFWVFVLYLVLGVGRLFPDAAGDVFRDISGMILFLLIVLCIPLLWRWIFGRLLWKVSNRLIVTYILMGLAPVVLFVTLALILLYVFSGQFAIFAAQAQIDSELSHLSAQDRAFAIHAAHEISNIPHIEKMTVPEGEGLLMDPDYVGAKAIVYDGDRRLTMQSSAMSSDEISKPAWFHGSFRGIVIDRGAFYLRAMDQETVGAQTVTTITSVPLHSQNIDQIARGLGTVSIIPDINVADEEHASQKSPRTTFRFERLPEHAKVEVNGEDMAVMEARSKTVRGGILPAAEHFYDIVVTFYAPLNTVDWTTGSMHSTYTEVSSRPSLLYRRLFITSLQIAAIVQNVLIAIAICFGVIELFAFFMAVRLNHTITQSIRDLYHATVAIDRGDLSHRIKVTRHDQLAALGRSFNNMTASLQRLLEEQREKERLQNELVIAQEVQANLFPRGNVNLPMLELHGACYPARTVSGDYYDFLVSGGGVALALGDISGKGISAALLMATLHSAVRAYRFAGEELVTTGDVDAAMAASQFKKEEELDCGEFFEDPGRILALLNRHLYRSTQPEKYATLFLGHYDGITRRLLYSNGGQLPPLLLRADDTVTRLDCGGTVVGLIDNMSYEQGTEHLRPGDILIAYSDGVTEPENEFGEFGEDRLLEVVRRHRHLSLAAISEQVMQSLRTWIGGQEQPDDITLVLARQL